ncbi:S24 family peptidase [Formosa sp. A9]|uniref:S24 family peptidase n=1 Tax=Formosa sp. A9 TaxID=3442641 RepID=UPI003EBB0971
MSYGSFKGDAKSRPLNSDAIENILTMYDDISANWLVTGDGEMTKNYSQSSLNQPSNVYKLRTDRLEVHQNIPLYNLEASAGLVELFQNQGDQTPIDSIYIPNLPKCDGALFVTGDSMYPLLKSGDIIAYKQIHDISNDIFWGEMYLVAVEVSGEEYVSVKYIQKSEKGDQYIKLVSQNQHHQPKNVLLKKVRALALIKASIRINSMR